MKKATLSAISLSAASLLFGSYLAPASADPGNPTENSAPAGCIQLREDGQQRWSGQPQSEITALGDAAQGLVDQNPGTTTGVAYCSDYRGVVLYIAEPDAATLASIEQLKAKHPNAALYVERVGASLRTLLTEADRLAASPPQGIDLARVSPNIQTGSLDVTLAARPSLQKGREITESTGPALAKKVGVNVPVKISYGEQTADATRRADSAPYWMGAELRFDSSACSAGVPIRINGSTKLLTAGHCQGTRFTNNGRFVGSTYTTAYPGNANRYGDWKLLEGSRYARRVFTGPLSSNQSMPISGALWSGRPRGTQLCASGRTTGQTCRYVVEATYESLRVNGVVSNHQTRMLHDSNLDGVGDDNGFKPGDSGGACYYTNNGKSVIAAGIVKGYSYRPGDPTKSRYYCTQLSGVKAWNKNAQLG